MHFAGINWAAVLAAAAAFFAIGYVIHMRLVLKAWDAAKHTDKAKLSKARQHERLVMARPGQVHLSPCSAFGCSGDRHSELRYFCITSRVADELT